MDGLQEFVGNVHLVATLFQYGLKFQALSVHGICQSVWKYTPHGASKYTFLRIFTDLCSLVRLYGI